MLPLNTDRLRFREMSPEDLDAMAAMLGDPDVMEFYPSPKTRAEAAEWIEWNQKNYATHGYGLWIIETMSGEFVGDCGLTWQSVNGTRMLEVGYHLIPDWHGLGLATEAATSCRDFARTRLSANELVAIVHPDNRASARVAEKIGMQRIAEDFSDSSIMRIVFGMQLADSPLFQPQRSDTR